MKRASSNRQARQSSRELEAIKLNLVRIRILHYASAGKVTAEGILERMREDSCNIGSAIVKSLLTEMRRSGCLRLTPRRGRKELTATEYQLTASGGRVLTEAKQHLEQLAAR